MKLKNYYYTTFLLISLFSGNVTATESIQSTLSEDLSLSESQRLEVQFELEKYRESSPEVYFLENGCDIRAEDLGMQIQPILTKFGFGTRIVQISNGPKALLKPISGLQWITHYAAAYENLAKDIFVLDPTFGTVPISLNTWKTKVTGSGQSNEITVKSMQYSKETWGKHSSDRCHLRCNGQYLESRANCSTMNGLNEYLDCEQVHFERCSKCASQCIGEGKENYSCVDARSRIFDLPQEIVEQKKSVAKSSPCKEGEPKYWTFKQMDRDVSYLVTCVDSGRGVEITAEIHKGARRVFGPGLMEDNNNSGVKIFYSIDSKRQPFDQPRLKLPKIWFARQSKHTPNPFGCTISVEDSIDESLNAPLLFGECR